MGTLMRAAVLCAVGGLAAAQSNPSETEPISHGERWKWAVTSTIGPASLAGGLVSAGLGTWMDQPREYDTNWKGFGKRYGMRLTGVSVSNTMEAGLGAVWGEDPRYPRAEGQPFKNRVAHVVKMTFLAPYREGQIGPAYERYAAIGGNNFISNAWRADSEATVDRAAIRIGLGFLGRMASNAFLEFWPDVKDRISKH